MVLEVVIPEQSNKESTTKDMIFSILVEDKAKTLTQLHREIKIKYKVSVSFQAVMKAVNLLLEKKVLIRKERAYSLNKDWIFEIRNFFDNLYTEYFKVRKPMKKIEMGKEITLYTVNNLLELDKLWNDLLTNWAKSETKDRRNCWKGRHAWWLVPRLQEEDILHDFMIQHGIKTYNVLTENTSLDLIATKYYSKKNEFAKIKTRLNTKTDQHIASFGDNLIKFEIPQQLSIRLEKIYQKTKKIENLDVKDVIDLFKENFEIELTLIKDRMLADKIKEEIISCFK